MNHIALIGRNRSDWIGPALLGTLFFMASLAVILWRALQLTDGHLVYTIDDPYIHMAIARNMAQHGVWGVTPYEWTSSDTTFLWPFILIVIIKIMGDALIWPLLLNMVFGSAILFFTAWALYQFRPKDGSLSLYRWYTVAILMLMVLLVPLPTTALTGMEHLLQLLLMLIFAYVAIQYLQRPAPNTTLKRTLLILAPILTFTRYELIFIIAAFVLILLWRRQFAFAVMILVGAALPPIIYGFIALSKGWYFLPSPILLKSKGALTLPQTLTGQAFLEYLTIPIRTGRISTRFLLLVPLLILPLIALVRRPGRWRAGQIALLLFGFVWFWQLQFMIEGYFYRYEAAGIGLGLFAFAIRGQELVVQWAQGVERRRTALLLAALATIIVVGFGARASLALWRTPLASANVYYQDYQMGRFAQQYYSGQRLAVNDIGAVTYLASPYLLDLWGLASMEILSAYVNDAYTPAVLDRATANHDSEAIMIFEAWYGDGIPESWVRVGKLRSPISVSILDPNITFFALDDERAAQLEANLRDFQDDLPAPVKLEIFTNYATELSP